MDFLKTLFGFLIQKDHLINKKVHTLGAVLVATCIISVLILGAGGYLSSMYQETVAEEQNSIAKEEESKELELLDESEEAIELPIDKDYKSQTMVDYIDFLVKEASLQVEQKTLALSTESEMELSTAGLTTEEEEEGVVIISADDVDVTPNREQIVLTDSDYEVLLRIVEAEVGTEDLYLRMMIANTIINRMQHDYYPDTIEEVVFQNDGKVYQFSPILDGRYWEVKVTNKTVEAVNNALAGYDNSGGSLAFVNRSLTADRIMKWFDDNLIYVTKYAEVEFFTF